MASLAILVAAVVFSTWAVAGLSVALSCLGFRLAGAAFGAVSLAVGVWLLCVLPHVPMLGAINMVAGGVAVGRYINNREGER